MKKNSNVPLARRIKKNSVYYVMIAPFFLIFFLFVFIPVISAVVLSFTSFDMVQLPDFTGFDNYIRLLFDDEIFLKALQNTLIFAVVTGPVGFLLSFVVAWLINELNPALRKFITLVMYAPTLAGNIYFIWQFIFASDSKGLANSVLSSLGILQDPVNWLTDAKYSFAVVIIVLIWMSLGTGFLSFVAGLQSLDRSYFEAAAIDGIKNRWQELFYVTLPQMGPQLMFGAVMQISAAFSVSDVIMNLAGWPTTEYASDTIVTYMLDAGSTRYEMGYACTIAVFLFVLMLLTNNIISKALQKFSRD